MAKILGQDYRLWIESAVAGTYNEIKGQQTLKRSRKSTQIETSTKEDYPYGTSKNGRRTLTIECEILPDLPDANGYGRLETQALANTATKFQIRKGGSAGASPADVVYEGSMNIADFDDDFPDSAPVKCAFMLTVAAAPTVDKLI